MTIISTPTEPTSGDGYDFGSSNGVLIITTSGVVASDTADGVYSKGTLSSDRVQNSGEIYGTTDGVYFAGNGDSLVNGPNATITGDVTGIYANGVGDAITNSANATITGSQQGISFGSTGGSITNGSGGVITGGNTGIFMAGQSNTLTNSTSGIISGRYTGAYIVGYYATLVNHGQIDGKVEGIGIESSTQSLINNSGNIDGGLALDLINDSHITITNSGTIAGAAGNGVTFGIGSNPYYAYTDDYIAIANSGTISGGINIVGSAEAIRNTGSITDGVTLTGNNQTIINPGSILGDVVITGFSSAIHNSGTIHGDISFGSGNNVFDGTGGTIDGTLTGGTGNDSFELGRQSVTGLIDGGAGIDSAMFATATGPVTVDLSAGTATGPGISDRLANFESVGGSIYADTLTGNDGNNLLYGDGGADTMTGGLGDDTYYVDNLGDKVVELANGGNDVIFSTVSYSLSGTFVETLALTGTANINATGNGNNNTLIGNSGNNVLDGGAGADTMTGGAGNDTYYVDNVGDKVVEATGGGTDIVYSSVSFSLSGTFVETLALTGTAAINATGNGQNNTLIGNSANNVIATGAGADIIVYSSATFGADTITDFTAGNAAGHDTIQFASSIFANFAAVTAHAAQVGADTIITYDAHDTIDLQNVTLANLTASDFAFA